MTCFSPNIILEVEFVHFVNTKVSARFPLLLTKILVLIFVLLLLLLLLIKSILMLNILPH